MKIDYLDRLFLYQKNRHEILLLFLNLAFGSDFVCNTRLITFFSRERTSIATTVVEYMICYLVVYIV